jgi:hypothetical protein
MRDTSDTKTTTKRTAGRARFALYAGGGSLALAIVSLQCEPLGTTGSNHPQPDAGSGSSGGSSGGGSDGSVVDAPAEAPISTLTGLHVQGNQFMDNGKVVRLLGVDHAGTEYQCIQAGTIFDGPTDTSLTNPMKSWGINTVRVPLNEDCWLGINGVAAAVSGTAYQQAIATFVQNLRSSGMYVILDLHWNAPGGTLSKAQQPMPDEDHASTFWQSVATAFKGDMGVVFDLYNEPHPDSTVSNPADCLLNGCMLSGWLSAASTGAGNPGTPLAGTFQAAGFQELVTTVRTKANAQNVIMIGGWNYANTIGSWTQYAPKDPLNNIAASFHNYNYTGCNDTICWNNNVKPVAAMVPVVTGELGENDCAESYIDSFFAWADPLGISYLGWSWNTDNCSSFPALISSYSGTPTAFGQGFMTHLPTQ